MTDDEALNAEIDQAAREVTAANPPAGFSARVRERLERPHPARRWVWQVAAATAVLIALAYMTWPEKKQPAAPVVATGTGESRPRETPGPEVKAPSGSRPAVSPSAPEVPSPARRPGPTRRAPRIAIDSEAPQIAALNDVPELTVPVTQPRDLDFPGLTVREVTIAPLEPDDKERR